MGHTPVWWKGTQVETTGCLTGSSWIPFLDSKSTGLLLSGAGFCLMVGAGAALLRSNAPTDDADAGDAATGPE
jgi:hypothetical protein